MRIHRPMTIRTISSEWEHDNKSSPGVTNYVIHIFQKVLEYGRPFGRFDIKQRLGAFLFRKHSLSHIMCQIDYGQYGGALSIFCATGEVTLYVLLFSSKVLLHNVCF